MVGQETCAEAEFGCRPSQECGWAGRRFREVERGVGSVVEGRGRRLWEEGEVPWCMVQNGQ